MGERDECVEHQESIKKGASEKKVGGEVYATLRMR